MWTARHGANLCQAVAAVETGLLNEFAAQIGLSETPVNSVRNMTGTLNGMPHAMPPFLVLPLYNAMRRIDKDLMHAAANLGVYPVHAFWRVFFPLSLPGKAAGSLIVWPQPPSPFTLQRGFSNLTQLCSGELYELATPACDRRPDHAYQPNVALRPFRNHRAAVGRSDPVRRADVVFRFPVSRVSVH